MESKVKKKGDASFRDIIGLIDRLRGENGCPWDRKQTPRSTALYLIEEAYELMDAIHSGSREDVCEELGDVLFLVLFIAVEFRESAAFTLQDVIRTNLEKMTRRHPHVFGSATADTAEEVKQRWRQIKMAEKGGESAASSILDSVVEKLPALMRCYRISERAARTGFDWHDLAGVLRQAEDEWQEFKKELSEDGEAKDREALAMEFGDVLFTLTNVGRLAGIHPEEALARSTRKFETRFRIMEGMAAEQRRPFESLSFEEMHELWDEAKKRCR